jgi:hypothetical protein
MQSVAHNGFGCPYCRTKMAEEPEEDEETVYEDVDEEDEEEEEDEDMFDEDALRGFRFFWNILNGEEHDEDDDADEQQLEEWADMAARNVSESDENIPTSDFVAQKLRQQGVSYEQLVKMILLQHEEYAEDEQAERLDNETFGKIRVIVSNYTPEQAVPTPVPQPVIQSIRAPVPAVDFEAQPKFINIHRVMLHD